MLFFCLTSYILFSGSFDPDFATKKNSGTSPSPPLPPPPLTFHWSCNVQSCDDALHPMRNEPRVVFSADSQSEGFYFFNVTVSSLHKTETDVVRLQITAHAAVARDESGTASVLPPTLFVPSMEELPRIVSSKTISSASDENLLKIWVNDVHSHFPFGEMQFSWTKFVEDVEVRWSANYIMTSNILY